MSKTVPLTQGHPAAGHPSFATRAAASNPDLSATRNLLRLTYGLVPVVAGIDKFTNLLVDWERYLNPAILRLLPLRASAFMGAVGVIEVVAGAIVLYRPRIGGFIVAAWLTAIALSLLAGGSYLDVAVRDLVMAIGALVLSRLTANAEAMDRPA